MRIAATRDAVRLGMSLMAGLPSLLREPVTVAAARAVQAAALCARNDQFLTMVTEAGFRRPDSALGRLLHHAGVESGDVRGLLAREGLEATLRALATSGVYVLVDEFKGRRELVRGSLRLQVGPGSFANPRSRYGIVASSSGSRSDAPPFIVDLSFVRAAAGAMHTHLDALGIERLVNADWEAVGAGARYRLLKMGALDAPLDAWFSDVDPADPDLAPSFRYGERILRWAAACCGRKLPRATVVPSDDARIVARWMVRQLERGNTPHVLSVSSNIAALGRAAAADGLELAGAYATMGGEPITAVRRDIVAASGLRPLPRYGSIETGAVGYACVRPTHSDDVHVVAGMHAVIRADALGAAIGIPENAILHTGLHAAAPFAAVNLSMGDAAEVTRSTCGCPVERIGWTRCLRDIRSFEKLTVAGITLHAGDLIRVLEEALPARFGGDALDYQLIEGEDASGLPTLALRIDPRLGEIDPKVALDALLAVLASGPPVHAVMAKMLRQSVALSLERGPPLRRRGKALHVHRRDPG